ncbi:MAG: zinc-ribbon domain-containing protein [Chloroflexi bacterium]|nr:zinc-ribbon domain-containing protein [Chloroflexota bacterium]
MVCSSCQASVPDGAKFCMSCGTAVAVVCPSCNTELPSEANSVSIVGIISQSPPRNPLSPGWSNTFHRNCWPSWSLQRRAAACRENAER